ncbi:hypothetical protein BGZ96_003321 [Linnemannia gamsii]|uniref:Up-regulated during septation protein 1 domain-containing protein n=1 Tax=Linnemannia gamsii TaxID=64522 RepID=A0ABQ7K8E7_9FUNG|nr:hypothetical protein BGZ96_003321 [Linnemannia gamsii]
MALMQRYLTSPDDPESEADIQMQIMISQAAVDSKGFEVLVPQSVESIKRHHATLSSRIAALTARLSLESKIREAAQSLLKLHADNKKLARQASDHLESANRKVDQVATELWKLTQLAADLQRTLLQHTSGVLALGVVRLEDQGRRERDVHALQLQEARVGKDVEEQFESMSRTIMNLESDTLEAQSLLEDKDRTIERLMRQLDHQRDLYVRLDEQQQKMMALSRSQQKDLDLLGKNRNDAKAVVELESFLIKVAAKLQGILQQQQQQQQQYRHQRQLSTTGGGRTTTEIDTVVNSEDQHHQDNERDRSAQNWPSDSTLPSKRSFPDSSVKTKPGREDSMSSSTRDGNNSNLETTVVSDRVANSSLASTLANDKNDDTATELAPHHISKERIFSTLDALDHFMTESQQKSHILEGELGLLRRQSVVLCESRNNSIKIKNFSSVRGQAAEETIRSALEKSLKDALLEKEIARQELENERQRWEDDQNHRISALEESLVAAEDSEKSATGRTSSDTANTNGASAAQENIIRTLRQQLQEAIDEIDILSQQQQSSLKSMRQLFDLIPDSRRKSHLQLFSAHPQQQHNGGSAGGTGSGRASPAGSISSVSSGNAAIGFSMETLIVRVKELVARSQQLEQDSSESKHPRSNKSTSKSHQTSDQTSHQGSDSFPSTQTDIDNQHQQQDSILISNSELERLQANAGMIQLLEKEIELLKQHTDMLLDENARLAEMAAASATAVSHPPSRSSADLRAMIRPPSKEDALDELHEIIRVKDTLLRERDQLVEEQERALLKTRSELAQAAELQTRAHALATIGGSPGSPPPLLSSFDVVALEDFRVQCDKLEEQNGEMRMIIAALEAAHGGPGSGAQLLKDFHSTNAPSSPNSTASWLSSRLGATGSLSFGLLTQKLSSEPTTSSSAINTPIPSSVDAFSNNNNSNSQSSQHQYQQSGAGTLSGGSNAAITSATAALRKEFRRVMTELREEKEKAVRKEVEERRRLERTVRQLRREVQAIQNSEVVTV